VADEGCTITGGRGAMGGITGGVGTIIGGAGGGITGGRHSGVDGHTIGDAVDVLVIVYTAPGIMRDA